MPFMGTNKFGGLNPRLDESMVPATAARKAENVDVTGGNVKSINVASPFEALHNGSTLKDQIPSTEVKHIPKPASKPGVDILKMLDAGDLKLEIWVTAYESHYDPDTDDWVTHQLASFLSGGYAEITSTQAKHTDYGFRISVDVGTDSFTQYPGIRHIVTPVLFSFNFTSAATPGPVSNDHIPEYFSAHNPRCPRVMMPFQDKNGVIIGTFDVFRCDHESAQREYYSWDIVSDAGVTRHVPADNNLTTAEFYVDMHYTYPRRHYYFVNSYFDDADREGPPSDISDLLTVGPGEHPAVTPATSPDYKTRLYRSSQSKGFLAVEGGDDVSTMLEDLDGDGNADEYADYEYKPLGDTIPMYGQEPINSDGTNDFISPTLLHPGQFGVAAKNESANSLPGEVWFSDVYRLHSWPREWMIKFETEIKAIQLVGTTVFVFTKGPSGDDGVVYQVSGNNPQHMSKALVIFTEPLLNELSLCKIGQALYYVSIDGVIGVSSQGPEIITSPYYTRRQWQALSPASYSAKVADDAIFLTHSGSGDNLRIDLDKNTMGAVTTWTDTSGVSGTWTSRTYSYPMPVRFSVTRIYATTYSSAISLTITDEDTGTTYSCSISSSGSVRTPRMTKSRLWSFTINVPDGTEVKHVAIASSTAELNTVYEQ